jgi:hypothetical protein
MNLFRHYLRWVQSAPTWLTYAARNQNLSASSTEPPVPTKPVRGGKVPEHSAPAGRAFCDKYYK